MGMPRVQPTTTLEHSHRPTEWQGCPTSSALSYPQQDHVQVKESSALPLLEGYGSGGKLWHEFYVFFGLGCGVPQCSINLIMGVLGEIGIGISDCAKQDEVGQMPQPAH